MIFKVIGIPFKFLLPFCYDFEKNTGTITDYNSDGGSSVVIPSTIRGVTVVAIGDEALRLKGLTSVSIPSTVSSIGYRAFTGNTLSGISLPSGLTNLGNEAFRNNSIT